MDISYLFWCSQYQKREESDKIKKRLDAVDGTMALSGLERGAVDVGEAFNKVHKEKGPDSIPEISPDVYAPRAAGEFA